MLTKRENVLAILYDEQPEWYSDFMEAVVYTPDPLSKRFPFPPDGQFHTDDWGTTKIWRPGELGPQPIINEETKVIKDIEHWEDYVHPFDLDELEWDEAEEWAANFNREEYLMTFLFGVGLFERSHFLMGFEDALCNYLEYPDEMSALLRVVCEYKKKYIRMVAEHMHPDLILYHDDWGSKQNVFLPLETWRSIIKPLQQEIADTIRECGMIYGHHSDCFLEPLIPDMIDLGVVVWHGALPCNDLRKLQDVAKGRLAMIGGIDGPAVDREGVSEEEVRAEVRQAFDKFVPQGKFFPSFFRGGINVEPNATWAWDELASYGREFFKTHPWQPHHWDD